MSMPASLLASLPTDVLRLIAQRLPLASRLALRAAAYRIGELCTDEFVTGWHIRLGADFERCTSWQRQRLARLKHLTQLDFNHTSADGKGGWEDLHQLLFDLAPFQHLNHVTRIAFSDLHLHSVAIGMSRLAVDCPCLTRLIVETFSTDAAMFKGKDELNRATADGWCTLWAILEGVPSLQELEVTTSNVISFEGLEQLSQLRRLRLRSYDDGNGKFRKDHVGVLQLSGLVGLTELVTDFSIPFINGLSCLSRLMSLDMASCEDASSASGTISEQVSTMSLLTKLVLSWSPPTQTPELLLGLLGSLQHLVQLEALCSEVPVSALLHMSSLAQLTCRALLVPPIGAHQRLPALRCLSVDALSPTSAGQSEPTALSLLCPGLESLDISGRVASYQQDEWFDDAVSMQAWLAALWPSDPQHAMANLRELSVRGTDASLPAITLASPALSSLTLSLFNTVQVPDMSFVGPRLSALHLLNPRAEGVFPGILSACPAIRRLSVDGQAGYVLGRGLRKELDLLLLCETCCMLRHITLRRCSWVTAESVLAVAQNPNVETIVVQHCRGFKSCADAARVFRTVGRSWLEISVE